MDITIYCIDAPNQNHMPPLNWRFHWSILWYTFSDFWHFRSSLKHLLPHKAKFLWEHSSLPVCWQQQFIFIPPAFFYKGLVASISVWQDKATVVGTNGCLLLFESLLLSRYFFAPCFGLDQLVARLPFRSDRNVPPELVSTLCSITTEQNWLKLNLAKAYYYFSIQMGSFLLHTSPPPNTLHKLTPLQFLLFGVLKACKSSHCDRINTRWQRLASVVLIVGPYKVAVMCSLQFRVL